MIRIVIFFLVATLMLTAEEELKMQERVGIDPILRGVWQMYSFEKEGKEENFSPPLDFATVTANSMTLANGNNLKIKKVVIVQRGDAPPLNAVVLENGTVYTCLKLPGDPHVLVQVLVDGGKVSASMIIRVVQ